MRYLQFLLITMSVVALFGWLYLRKPASASDTLAPVCYTAFISHATDMEAGQSLAQAALEWEGVSAASYNAHSDLLVIAHTDRWTPATLKSRLSTLTSSPPQIKQFSPSSGAQCPVPLEVIQMIPGFLLTLSILSALVFAGLMISNKKKAWFLHINNI